MAEDHAGGGAEDRHGHAKEQYGWSCESRECNRAALPSRTRMSPMRKGRNRKAARAPDRNPANKSNSQMRSASRSIVVTVPRATMHR